VKYLLILLVILSLKTFANEVKYCPPYDVVLGTYVSIEEKSCLRDLDSSASIDEIENCYAPKKLRWYFSQLRLMNVTKSCLSKIKKPFVEHRPNCGNSSCGKYTEFSNYLVKRLGIEEDRFTHEDAINLINSL